MGGCREAPISFFRHLSLFISHSAKRLRRPRIRSILAFLGLCSNQRSHEQKRKLLRPAVAPMMIKILSLCVAGKSRKCLCMPQRPGSRLRCGWRVLSAASWAASGNGRSTAALQAPSPGHDNFLGRVCTYFVAIARRAAACIVKELSYLAFKL